MKLSQDTLRKKMLGCFLGKSAGGTLGQPYEGWEGPLGLTYYDPVPTEMPPNDDLDLQVVNLETVMRLGLPISRLCIGSFNNQTIAEMCLCRNHI